MSTYHQGFLTAKVTTRLSLMIYDLYLCPHCIRVRQAWHQPDLNYSEFYHVLSAKHGVKDDFAFLWEHAIFRHPPNKNPPTHRSEILHS
jgi:hypothetical protein